jgi:voltage-dependent calcium channel L type alpha-1S
MRTFDQISFVCVVIFTTEMVLKMMGLGLYYYFHDNFNKFDACIVCTSLIELAIAPPPFLVGKTQAEAAGAVGFSALRILRIIRILRIARLVEMFPSMQQVR